MKCYAVLTLALAALTVASPMQLSKKNSASIISFLNFPSNKAKAPASGAGAANASGDTQAVSDSINKWLKDIEAVNKFVDTAGTLKDNAAISKAASTALVAAKDEGVNNDALANLTTLDASGKSANKGLAAQFAIIGPAIKDTVSNPQNLKKNLAAINGAR